MMARHPKSSSRTTDRPPASSNVDRPRKEIDPINDWQIGEALAYAKEAGVSMTRDEAILAINWDQTRPPNELPLAARKKMLKIPFLSWNAMEGTSLAPEYPGTKPLTEAQIDALTEADL